MLKKVIVKYFNLILKAFLHDNWQLVLHEDFICTSPYVTKVQHISIYLGVNVTFKYITDACSYRHISFTILLKRKAHALIKINLI